MQQQNLDNNTLISMMDQLHRINMDPEFSLTIPCPHIAVIGDQGLGKSTTLNRLLGAEILPMRQSTHENSICTIFPTVYHTIYSDDQVYTIQLWSKYRADDEYLYGTTSVYTCEEIKNTVKMIFAEFYTKNSRDYKIERVRVVVKGPGLANRYVVDLPGIRNDKSEQSMRISSQILNYLDENLGAILLFFLPSSGPERTSAWSIIHKYSSTNMVIAVLIRPDELGKNDKSVMNILIGKTDIKLPNENVFVIKNPNTMNNEIFDIKKADIDEMSWFKTHPIYGYNVDPLISKKFGFVELANKIIHILTIKYCSIIPKIMELVSARLHTYKLQRNQLRNQLVVDESNKLLIYKSLIDEFLKKIRGINNGEIICKVSGLNIKSKIKEFCDVAKTINYTGKYTSNEINTIISQCGGTRDLYTKFSESVLINVIFTDDKSPAKYIDLLIQQYIETIAKIFKEIIFDIDFSNSYLDQQFWNILKEKFVENIDKKNVIDGLSMLCTAQESYFDFEPLCVYIEDYVNVEKGDEIYSPKDTNANNSNANPLDTNNINNNTKHVLAIMEQIWAKYSFTIRSQFGKYIQKHFVEYNLREDKMDHIFYNKNNIEYISQFMKESEGIEKRREELDKNIEKLEKLLDTIDKMRT